MTARRIRMLPSDARRVLFQLQADTEQRAKLARATIADHRDALRVAAAMGPTIRVTRLRQIDDVHRQLAEDNEIVRALDTALDALRAKETE